MRITSDHLDAAHQHSRLREYVLAGGILFLLFAAIAVMSANVEAPPEQRQEIVR